MVYNGKPIELDGFWHSHLSTKTRWIMYPCAKDEWLFISNLGNAYVIHVFCVSQITGKWSITREPPYARHCQTGMQLLKITLACSWCKWCSSKFVNNQALPVYFLVPDCIGKKKRKTQKPFMFGNIGAVRRTQCKYIPTKMGVEHVTGSSRFQHRIIALGSAWQYSWRTD